MYCKQEPDETLINIKSKWTRQLKVHLTPNIFLAPQKLLVLLITTVKKLSSYDLSSIFGEFSNFAKFAPLWFTAESQGKLGPSKVVTSAAESNTLSLSCLMTSFESLKLFRWLIFELRSFKARNFTNCRFVAPSARKLKFDSPLTSQQHWVPDLLARGREPENPNFKPP